MKTQPIGALVLTLTMAALGVNAVDRAAVVPATAAPTALLDIAAVPGSTAAFLLYGEDPMVCAYFSVKPCPTNNDCGYRWDGSCCIPWCPGFGCAPFCMT